MSDYKATGKQLEVPPDTRGTDPTQWLLRQNFKYPKETAYTPRQTGRTWAPQTKKK